MSTSVKTAHIGLNIPTLLNKDSTLPMTTVEWEERDALITSQKGEVVFEQKGVRVPKSWSQTATNIVASKYLHGTLGTPQREHGVDELIDRVVGTITAWGAQDGYFATLDDEHTFHNELTVLLLHQYAAFNSPVWFNVGCDRSEPDSKSENWHWNAKKGAIEYGAVGYTRPQCAACFINGVTDSMRSILELAKTEGMLFKGGSGAGSNLSAIRSDGEGLAGGGTASGPLSFMKGFDAFAGVIKSGGKTRRAAKMVILNADHPDIEAFIACKRKEEAKAQALIAAGYDGSGPDSEAYASIFFQNANNSVRVTDEFMEKAVGGGEANWALKAVTTGEAVRYVDARGLLRQVAEATWAAGDPGMQYDTTINGWHTVKNSGRINASNPCSEFMFLDDSACNLASLNLMKFLKADGTLDVELLQHAIRIMTIAQDILVDNSGYPTEVIAKNSHDYRPLGLGYANLGALLMHRGLPYDSDEGRDLAAAITSIMTGHAYSVSAEIAAAFGVLPAAGEALREAEGDHEDAPRLTGAFPGFFTNEEPMMEVIKNHRAAAEQLYYSATDTVPTYLRKAAIDVWNEALDRGEQSGYRNAQVTVLAPTGTIGFMMDCDTTGIEPMLGLVVYKKLVGGGSMELTNESIAPALYRLRGYNETDVDEICEYVKKNATVEGCSTLSPDHVAIFDCALKPKAGTRSISWLGHLKMMAAVQPFLSGAISKTVNMPNEASVEDIMEAYIKAWQLGLKSVAIYRDGSKQNQVLTVKNDAKETASVKVAVAQAPVLPDVDPDGPPKANRNRLPDERAALTHKFKVGGHEGYFTVGLYKNGQPGELFITMSKQGSTMSGLMGCFATSISVALQHGVPLHTLISKFAHTRFEPSGWSGNQEIGYANSLMDYIFRWLEIRFIKGEQLVIPGVVPAPSGQIPTEGREPKNSGHTSSGLSGMLEFGDAPSCSVCGSLMSRNGACFRCDSCGSSSGCS